MGPRLHMAQPEGSDIGRDTTQGGWGAFHAAEPRPDPSEHYLLSPGQFLGAELKSK